MQLGVNRPGKLSFGVRRFFVACALVPCVLAVANYHLQWGLFGKFDRWVLAASFVSLFLVLRYLAPTVQEIRDLRSRSGSR